MRLINGVYEENCIITPLSFFKSVIISANKNNYMFNFNRQNDVQEFLMIVGTKEKINFLNSYSSTEFGKKLADILYFRQHRKSYIIHKRTD